MVEKESMTEPVTEYVLSFRLCESKNGSEGACDGVFF